MTAYAVLASFILADKISSLKLPKHCNDFIFQMIMQAPNHDPTSFTASVISTPLKYQKTGVGKYRWSPDNTVWIDCPNFVVPSGIWANQTPVPENVSIIKFLGSCGM
jgi:hypothetical protein